MKPLNRYVDWRVLVHFLRNPTKRFYVQELSRTMHISSRSALEAMHRFKEEGLLKRTIIGQSHLYYIDNEQPLVKALKRMDILDRIREAKLVERFLDADEAIISLILYGSYSSGDNDEKSDLDLLIISSTDRSRFTKPQKESQNILGLDVNIEIFKHTAWTKLKREDDVFSSEVRRNHIVLYGSDVI